MSGVPVPSPYRSRKVTRALPITEHQARTLLRAAGKEGGIVEVKIGETVIRLVPASLAQEAKPIEPEEEIEL